MPRNALVVIPMQEELDLFVGSCVDLGQRAERRLIGRLAVVLLPGLGLTIARGGTGKAQFGIQTQHLLDAGGPWRAAFCAGGAGGLSDNIAVGDVVVATETIEHDYRNRFNHNPIPRFLAAPEVLAALRQVEPGPRVHFGPIASGDEDIVDGERRAELRQATGALAAAWEGAGGARACAFSGIPFVEIRGITDAADPHAPASFHQNLKAAMAAVAAVLVAWAAAEERRR